MRHFCFLTLLICLGAYLPAQSFKISGTVTEEISNEPMVGILVSLRPAGENKVVKFAQTSSNGTFEIELSAFPENHLLHFSMMGFAPQTVPLEPGQEIYNIRRANALK